MTQSLLIPTQYRVPSLEGDRGANMSKLEEHLVAVANPGLSNGSHADPKVIVETAARHSLLTLAASPPSSSVVLSDEDEDDSCYIENASYSTPRATTSDLTPSKHVPETPETSVYHSSDEDDISSVHHDHDDDDDDDHYEDAMEDLEDFENNLTMPELFHVGILPSLLSRPTTYTVQQEVPQTKTVEGNQWLSTIDSELSDIVRAIYNNKEEDADTFDGMEEESVFESESVRPDEHTKEGVVPACRTGGSSDVASVSSDGAVVPEYGVSSQPKKSRRTLEKLITGAGDSVMGESYYDTTDDDDGYSTNPPTVEVAFEDLWSEEASQIVPSIKQLKEEKVDRMQDAPSIDSGDVVGVYEDTSTSTRDITEQPVERISKDSSEGHQTSKKKNSMLITAAILFGGMQNKGRAGTPNSRGSRTNKDEVSTTSSAKEKVAAAVSTLQKSVSQKLVVVGKSVTPVVSSLQKTASKKMEKYSPAVSELQQAVSDKMKVVGESVTKIVSKQLLVVSESVTPIVFCLQRTASKRLDKYSPAVSGLQQSVSKNMKVVGESFTKSVLPRNKSCISAAETSAAATPTTTTNPESISVLPDLEAQEVNEEYFMDEEGVDTVVSTSLDSKDSVVHPQKMLWITILSLLTFIIMFFLATLLMFAMQA